MDSSALESALLAQQGQEVVSLRGLGIASLQPLLPRLASSTVRSLDLSRNNISSLPLTLASLRQLEVLDLSGNPTTSLDAIMGGLRSLPALKHLHVDLPLEKEEDELIVSLPQLESLNGTNLMGHASVDDSAHGRGEWTAEDSQRIENLFADVTLAANAQPRTEEFFDFFNRVVRHLRSLCIVEEDPLARRGEVLKAHKILFMYCFEEMAQATAKVDAEKGKGVHAALRYASSLLDQYDLHWRSLAGEREGRLEGMRKDVQEAAGEIQHLMAQLNNSGSGTDAARALHDSAAERGEITRLRAEVERLHADNTRLRAQYKDVMDRLHEVSAPLSGTPAAATTPSRPRTEGHSKVMTLRQLKDFIEEVYSSKTQHDEKCKETHLPRETMEQHMYTYLNQRYGLKHIIVDWANAVTEGIKQFATSDNDVAVFGMILRNEIDEEFRYVQRQVRETAKKLLRNTIRQRLPCKGDSEINRVLQQTMKGTVAEEDWRYIVEYMYNKEDAEVLLSSLRHQLKEKEAVSARPARTRGRTATPPPATQLSYTEVLHTLLDFQLAGHQGFLAPYVSVFRQHDKDLNGIVNGDEFLHILRRFYAEKNEEELEIMLAQIDPYGNQLITFSESVTFLSDHLIDLPATDKGHR